MTELILASLKTYGVPLLLFLSWFGLLGIPFPISMVIVAAGAFTRVGVIDWKLALLACLAGAALADTCEYLLGRLAGRKLFEKFSHRLTWQQAQAAIDRQGVWAVLLTRFWLTPLAPAVNIIAGSRYPYAAFLFFDFLGQFLWVALYGGLGYLFAARWQQVSQALGIFSWLSVGAVLLIIGVMVLGRRSRLKRHV